MKIISGYPNYVHSRTEPGIQTQVLPKNFGKREGI